MTDNKTRSERIQDTLKKGMLSVIKEKAEKGEKDEFGIPYASHYKFLTGKTIKSEMSAGGMVSKNYVNPVTVVDNRKK
jgi:hypothetical protein